jgi:3-hydroxyisobutyrate dehydrogenase
MARIGFLGLGNMGRGMALRLAAAGHEVVAYNRTRAKAEVLQSSGIQVADTARAAAQEADAVFSMVGDDAASRAMWLEEEGALAAQMRPGAFVVECSTLSYDWVKELGQIVAVQGLRYIDCPVTGLPDAAASGQLVLLVGADDADLKAATPILAPMNKEIIHFGPVGTGTVYKLMVNLIGAIQIASIAEGMMIAKQGGLDLEKVAHALGIGQAAAPQVMRSVKRFIADDHHKDIVFSGKLRLKDASYGVDLARALGVDSEFGQMAVDAYARLGELGLDEQNETAVINAVGVEGMRKRNN